MDLEIQVTATDAITYSNLRLRVVLVESDLYYNGGNGIYDHHQTFRDMIPSTNGSYFTISEGQKKVFNYSNTHSSIYVPANCEIIAFIQSDSNKRIMQGAKEGLTTLPPPPYELDLFSLLLPVDTDTVNNCYPEFNWQPSDDPDSGYAINYEVEIDTDSSFSNALISPSLSDTSWASLICLLENRYFWRVKAFNNHAPDIYSDDIFSFQIKQYGRITGVISDELDNPIENILVELQGYEDKSDYTDQFGIYVLDSLYADTYILSVSHIDYHDSLITDIPMLPGDTVDVNITLEEYYCPYYAGDANGDGHFNGVDVLFLSEYFKGSTEPSISCDCEDHGLLFVGADPNGSCTVNAVDISYMINILKNGGDVVYCPDCYPNP